jgi:hypothetical protein
MIISGMAMVPMAATVAGPEPDIAANIARDRGSEQIPKALFPGKDASAIYFTKRIGNKFRGDTIEMASDSFNPFRDISSCGT